MKKIDTIKLFTIYFIVIQVAMGIMMPFNEHYEEAKIQLTQQELEEIERVRKTKALERKKNRGLKEWYIDGIKVIALNKKNATRKALRMKELLIHD